MRELKTEKRIKSITIKGEKTLQSVAKVVSKSDLAIEPKL